MVKREVCRQVQDEKTRRERVLGETTKINRQDTKTATRLRILRAEKTLERLWKPTSTI